MYKIMPVDIPLLLSEKLSGRIPQLAQSQPTIRWPWLESQDTLGIPVIATTSNVIGGARSTSHSVTRLFPPKNKAAGE